MQDADMHKRSRQQTPPLACKDKTAKIGAPIDQLLDRWITGGDPAHHHGYENSAVDTDQGVRGRSGSPAAALRWPLPRRACFPFVGAALRRQNLCCALRRLASLPIRTHSAKL